MARDVDVPFAAGTTVGCVEVIEVRHSMSRVVTVIADRPCTA
jgi:hypothetical protein